MSPSDGQLPMPFACDEALLGVFLTAYLAIEDAHDRLREETRALKDQYASGLPMRAVLAAVKIVRTRAKLAQHPTEGMSAQHLPLLEQMVQACLERPRDDASDWDMRALQETL